MSDAPVTRFVTVGDGDVAYQVTGDGPVDLVYFYGLGAHLEMFWDAPHAPVFLRRLASFSRLIMFNRLGNGASDGLPRDAAPTWEERMEELGAVLDAVGSTSCALLATLDAGPVALLFAAMHPERVTALMLLTTAARYLHADDYPCGATAETIDATVDGIEALWGTPDLVRLANPSMAEDQRFLDYGARWYRSSATPGTAAAQLRYMLRNVDVRDHLPLVQVPTLIMHVRESALCPIEHGRYLAERIEGATFVELPGGDTAITPQNFVVADEVAQFLTGTRPSGPIDRVLTTVLFTDIVGSTQLAASLGDAAWLELLDRHDRATREQFATFGGQEVKATGDGFCATFDGPSRAIRCGLAIVAAARDVGVEVRAGLHTGECSFRAGDLGGLAVHIAARVGALAGPSEVLVSSATRDLAEGAGLGFGDRGRHELTGVPEPRRLWAAIDRGRAADDR